MPLAVPAGSWDGLGSTASPGHMDAAAAPCAALRGLWCACAPTAVTSWLQATPCTEDDVRDDVTRGFGAEVREHANSFADCRLSDIVGYLHAATSICVLSRWSRCKTRPDCPQPEIRPADAGAAGFA